MKNGNTCGPDESPKEILKLRTGTSHDFLVQRFNEIYESGIIPGEWWKSVFIALSKVGCPKQGKTIIHLA